MLNLRSSIRISFVSIAVLLMTFALPVVSLATASADEVCAPPSSTEAGVHWPTGSDAATFTYQCEGPYAGKWTNSYYVFDPATLTRTPLYSPDYQYDCATGKWSKISWDFSAADGQYHQSRVITSAPAGVPTNCPVPEAPATTPSTGGANSTSVGSTGPSSTNTSTTTGNNTYTGNNTTNASLNNTITGVSTSGNSLVLGNTSAGGAISGDVQDMTNIVNMLQSSSNALGDGSNLVVFTANIDGDVNGDLILDPSMINQVQPTGTTSSNTNLNNNVVINNASDTAINNDINLAATSGDATVAGNTSAGDATTGSAKVIANIVNIINSAITSGKSFLGVININGNLNGDILLPPDFIDQLIAANVPQVTITAPASNNTSNTTVNNNTSMTNTNNQGITNNIDATAASGNASAGSNTSAGNATSGNATTTITAFNLTGSNIIGRNALLVFVNVTGKWVGLIVNAPPGATSAALGGGITQNTTVNNNTTINNDVNQQINNNITTAARSGNADVHYNTKAGNARSGDASNAINLLNVEDSSISLTGWLGILFINVFGTWNGSFGINTSAGDPIASPGAAAAPSGMQVFRFVPNSGQSGQGSQGYSLAAAYTGNGSVQGASTDISAAQQASAFLSGNNQTKNPGAPQGRPTQANFSTTVAIIIGCVALYILADAMYTRRHPERA